MSKYKSIPRTCCRCGKKGTTDNIHPQIVYKIDDGEVSSVYLQKWKNICDPCNDRVAAIIKKHMESLKL